MSAGILNTELLEELKDVMEDGFGDLIHTYLSDSYSRLDALEKALADENPARFREFSHAFKGSSANLGAEALAAICYEAEKMGSTGNLTAAKPKLEQIRTAFQLVEVELNRLINP